MSETYYAKRPIQIQQVKFAAGDEIGTGNIKAGEFKASKKAEGSVDLGHVLPRVADGRVVTEKPDPEAPGFPAKKKTASKSSK